MGQSRKALLSVLAVPSGIVCIIAGLIFLPLPTPFGLPLLVLGAALILGSSQTARRRFKALRQRHESLDINLQRAEAYLPRRLRLILSRTRPWPRRQPEAQH